MPRSVLHRPTSRRDWLRLAALSLGASSSGWLEALADESHSVSGSRKRRACLVLWMGGGPSQIDTFDMKSGHANGGPFKEIATSAPGIRFSEYLPRIAKWAHRLAIVRSLTTKEGDHARATRFMQTGYSEQGPIQFPPLGSLVAKELADPGAELPNCISIAPNRNVERGLIGGFLGPSFAPLSIGGGDPATNDERRELRIANLSRPPSVTSEQLDARWRLLTHLDGELGRAESQHSSAELRRAHRAVYEKAMRLMQTEAASAFDLDREPATLRDAYGRSIFGQGCLLARRLIERGVPFVEVNLSHVGDENNSWDTHQQNFDRVRRLCEILDPAWATLMQDLDDRSLLDSTTIVWMGEFGRTPKINNNSGRDHYPKAWTAVLAGGGVAGGQFIGRTTADGIEVAERPITGPDLIATICQAVDIDPRKQNLSNVGRPIRIADPKASPINEALL